MESASPILKSNPWRIVVAAELSPEKNPGDTFKVDKSSIGQLFSDLKPALNFYVTNHCRPETKHLNLSLEFSSLKDFTPDALITKIPELNWLLDLKKSTSMYLNEALDPKTFSDMIHKHPIPDALFQKMTSLPGVTPLQKSSSSPITSIDSLQDSENTSAVDSILSIMETALPTRSPEATRTALNGKDPNYPQTVIQEQNRGALDRVNSIDATIDFIIGMQIDEILHHPRFRALETAWRELKFVLDQTDCRAGITLEVLSCDKSSLSTALLQSVFKPVWESQVSAPDLVASFHPFSCHAPDYEQAANLARMGNATQTPVLLGAGADFFGAPDYQSLNSSVPSIQLLLNGCGYETWRGLRDKEEANWLILGANSFYLRPAYGEGGLKTKSFRFTENHKPRDIPHGSASAVIASLISRLAASPGKESVIQFQQKARLEEISALNSYTDPNNSKMHLCVNILSMDQISAMTDFGLCPVNCSRRDMSIFLDGTKAFGSSLYSIPSILLAGYISRLCVSFVQNHRELPCGEVSELISASLKNILCGSAGSLSGEQVGVVQVTEAEGGCRSVTLEVVVPYPLWGERVEINLSFET